MHKIESGEENNETGWTKDDYLFQAEGALESKIKN